MLSDGCRRRPNTRGIDVVKHSQHKSHDEMGLHVRCKRPRDNHAHGLRAWCNPVFRPEVNDMQHFIHGHARIAAGIRPLYNGRRPRDGVHRQQAQEAAGNMGKHAARCGRVRRPVASEERRREEVAAEKQEDVDGVVDQEEVQDGEEEQDRGPAGVGKKPVGGGVELKGEIVEDVAVHDDVVEERAQAVEDGGVQHGGGRHERV